MKSAVVLQFLLMEAVLTIFYATSSYSSTLANARLANFTVIGPVDGKTYFAEQNTEMSWAQSKSFCNASGMHLATIKSAAQWNLLKTASFGATYYWTGGRDSRSPSQFSWDFDEETLNTSFASFDAYGAISTCVYFYAYSHTLRSDTCSSNWRPLCEFNHGK